MSRGLSQGFELHEEVAEDLQNDGIHPSQVSQRCILRDTFRYDISGMATSLQVMV